MLFRSEIREMIKVFEMKYQHTRSFMALDVLEFGEFPIAEAALL